MSNYHAPKNTDSMYLGGEEDWQQLWPKIKDLPSQSLFSPKFNDIFNDDIRKSYVHPSQLKVNTPKPAIERQVGGSHYKDKGSSMQPWAIIDAWGLDFYGGNVLKYILRAKHKGGLEDLQKARHYLDKMIEDADPK